MNRNLVRNQRGTGFIEVIIALAILGIVAVVFLGGLGTSLKTVFISDESSTALALAQSQMEYVKSQEYSGVDGWAYTLTTSSYSYSPDDDPSWPEGPSLLSSDYSGYCVKAEAEEIDTVIRNITITVYHNENCTGDIVFTLEDYKVER